MLSVDENDSGDDYEFDENLSLRASERERVAFKTVEWHADSAQRRTKDALDVVDKSGVWTVVTTGGALLITAFDSLFDTGTVDPVALSVLAPDWNAGNGDASFLFDALAGAYVDPGFVASAEATLQGVFLFEFCLRAWAERFSPAYLKSPVALVDFAAILPSVDVLFGGIGGASASAALRPLRLFRLLRLLRLTDDGGGGVGAARASETKTSDKVASVAVEFLCVFLIAGELFYDLEYDVNPAIGDVGDALYWSFLTLTGIGQPFEAVTAPGRVATVASVLAALVVVPLQLAKIVGANRDDLAGAPGLPGLPGLPGADGDSTRRTPNAAETLAGETFETRATEARGLGPVETDPGAVRSGSAYASMRRELADARARLRAFEDEVDALRAENAALRSVATRRRIKEGAERRS